MRTNVVVNDELMNRALRSGGYRTKKSTIEAGLRLLVQLNAQKKIKNLKGAIHWKGSLENMRRD